MCLGIPMQVKSLDEFTAKCEAKNVIREASLLMMQGETISVGDYLVIHGGYAIQKVTEQEAQAAWEIYDQMLAAESA